MSEEKWYMVKNDEGKYWDFNNLEGLWKLTSVARPISEDTAKNAAKEHGGHIVTLIEEPEKVVITKEQAEIVEKAHVDEYPATYISENTGMCDDDNEELLMRAYVNGYTVAKEKKYYVKVPHTKDVWYSKAYEAYSLTICLFGKELSDQFTESEIEHYGLEDCERVECDNDGK